MIYIARELLAKLSNLTLVGQNDEGVLEWTGTASQWKKSVADEEESLIFNHV